MSRPKKDIKDKKIPVGYKLPYYLVMWLRSQDAAAAVLIEEALVEKHGEDLKEYKEGDV